MSKDNITGIEKWNAQKLVLHGGSNANLFSSVMDDKVLEEFKDYSYTAVNVSRTVANKDGDKSKENSVNVALFGFDKTSKINLNLVEGNFGKNDSEVVASISLKKEDGINIGDKITVGNSDKVYTITGFTEEAKISVASVIYTNLEDSGASKMASAMSNGPKTKTITALILHDNVDVKSTESYEVATKKDVIMKLPGFFAQILTFGLMIGFLILISAIVLGVFMYIITIQKKQSFAIMKIQGISNKYIGNSVIMQTFIVSSIGVIVGLLLTIITELSLPTKVPFESNGAIFSVICLAIILTSLLGAIFSVRSVKKVDPLSILG